MGRPKKDDLKKINLERENLARLYADKVINEHKTIRKIGKKTWICFKFNFVFI